jgi:arginine-tRNA-protein transferase
MLDVAPEEVDGLLCRGWRHFGPGWFRPSCTGCQACLSTRIVVDAFTPSRSQRRAQRRARNLRAEISEPIIDEARLRLFHTWQNERVASRAWESTQLSEQDYFMRFAFPSTVAREVAYDADADDRLVMVAICDETPQAWSAVFCFYDPAYARMSPGVANILRLVDIARATSRRFVYLGYLVLACQSLRYKADFCTQEMLVGLPSEQDTPRWVRSDPRLGPIGPG